MEAWVLKTHHTDAAKAFELQDIAEPDLKDGFVRIEVEAFGLNFADVMARQGLYADAPPLPAVLGYEVVGRIEAIGDAVDDLKVGQRVVALTRFGGYARKAITDARAVVPISEEMDVGTAAALATQYGTAYYAAYEMAPLFEEQKVLVQAAAGGVGTALVQMAKLKGCTVFGTAGSAEKLDYLREQGVDFPINYREQDFYEVIKKEVGDEGLDVVFDSIGGKSVKKGFKLLGSGGRIVCYGAAIRSGQSSKLKDLRMAIGFGLYSPISLLTSSRGIIGLNMLRLADHRPLTLKRALHNVAQLVMDGKLKPTVGAVFNQNQLAEAHHFLSERKSIGKIVVKWDKG
jgi:NADPH:quinone reductase-like Zn-dependent oxidoreductase